MGVGSPKLSPQEGAVGSQESGDTLNSSYSAGEMLKAPVSSEGRINFLPSNSLVGALFGLALL